MLTKILDFEKSSILYVSLLLLAILFRIISMAEPLWLDEIWTIQEIRALGEFEDIIFKFRLDNNHLLQSCWVYFVGQWQSAFIFRLFSFICSLIFLLLIFRDIFRKKKGAKELLFLVSFSYIFVLYAVEVRGYSPMLLGVLVAYQAIRDSEEEDSVWLELGFYLGSLIAILSHISALSFIAALLAVALMTLPLAKSLRLTAFVSSVLALIWVFFYANIDVGGGDIHLKPLAVFDLLSVAFGGFELARIDYLPYSLAIIAVSILVILWALLESWSIDRKKATFFILTIFIFPAASILFLSTEVIYPRYFLCSLLAIYLLLSNILAEEKFYKFKIIFCLLFLLSNSFLLYLLYKYGRGDYRKALDVVMVDSGAVSFDKPFRHLVPLTYYAKKEGYILKVSSDLNLEKLPHWIRFKEHEAIAKWYFKLGDENVPTRIQLGAGNKYSLYSQVTSTPLSGNSFGLYLLEE